MKAIFVSPGTYVPTFIHHILFVISQNHWAMNIGHTDLHISSGKSFGYKEPIYAHSSNSIQDTRLNH